MVRINSKNFLLIILGIVAIAGVYAGFSNPTYMCFLAAYLLIFVVISNGKKKKIWFYRNYIQKGKIIMEKQVLERLLNKNVVVHTVDEYITGVVAEVTESTIIIKKMKKDGNVKHTYYVQNNAIMSILENN